MKSADQERYRLYIHLSQFKRKVDNAKRIIENFIEGGGLHETRNSRQEEGRRRIAPGECGLSISWGKDSVVLAHLVASVLGAEATNTVCVQYGTPKSGIWTETLWTRKLYKELSKNPDFDNGTWSIEPLDNWPDLVNVRDKFLSLYPINSHEVFMPSFTYLCDKYGCNPITPDMVGGGKNISLVEDEFVDGFAPVIDGEMKRNGYIGGFIGMRQQESQNRERLFAMRGHTYYNKGRDMWTCCPLWDWTGDEIWAYTVINELPYSEIYDAEGYDRRIIRNGVMIGGGEARWGAFVFFRRLYPELWHQVCLKYPFLSSFG